MKGRIDVFPRREILDPQGKAISAALQRAGYPSVTAVHAGKSFEIELDAADRAAGEKALREMAERILANTVVEEYRVTLMEDGAK